MTGAAGPVEEYLRTSYEPDMEYVDGQLVERSVGEHRHSHWQGIRYSDTRVEFAREERGLEAYPVVLLFIRALTEFPMCAFKAIPYEPTPVL